MRICRIKSTGRIIEMQSHATEGTLIGNAVNAGYSALDVEEVIMSQTEYDVAMLAQRTPEEIGDLEVKKMISDKIRQLAIDGLVEGNKIEIIDGKPKKKV